MIFNFFKSIPTLKELIPNGFVDIHSHILPGIDDGAKDINESKILIEEMKTIGFSKIIGTPHTYSGLYDNTSESIENAFKKIKKLHLKDIVIDFASEYMLDHSMIEKSKNKNLLCLKDNYVLVEMSYISKPVNLYEIIFQIIHNGYRPILAHPERYRFIQNDFEEYYKIKKVGCLFQLNLLSCTNYYGKDIADVSEKLLKNNLIDFVGSDIHRKEHIKYFNKPIKIKSVEKLQNAIIANDIFR
tara:strand:+ start:14 stop:742 length:729 start_codon:yes stop_codon:yes gene_type:complete